ncbi:MAG: GGDEF domain-containing protein [Gammaproteobacteria bacterium]|nr:GGDEF domain-containing protein [Gammaproteobacteria bacterium]MBU2180771.1 GGDEF domain-containing protein [Gammaproteobacteria bacterium]MBU2428753.1 GGDEF domain-containing protein [Gammaproteobacteria bacterium]
MDAQTLVLVNTIVSFVMTLTMFGLYLANRQQHSLIDWSFAGAAFFANSLLNLLYNMQTMPYLLGPPLGNTFLVASYLFLLSGICHYLGQPLRLSFLLSFLIVTYLLNTTDYAQADVFNRILLNYPLLIAINLYTVYRVLAARLTMIRAAVITFVVVLSCNIVQMLLRLTIFVLIQLQLVPMEDNTFSLDIGSLAVLLFLLLAMISCMLLLVRQKTLQLQQLAETDPLTGWLNRHSMVPRLDAEWQRCQRQSQPLSIIAFDIDHFKQVNDQHGHQTGDRVLQQVCQLAAAELRGYDMMFRIGGEEFIACLPNVSADQLQQISERLRQKIANHRFDSDLPLSVSISVGCATATPQHEHWSSLLDQADKAQYQAKRRGRNQVFQFDPLAKAILC